MTRSPRILIAALLTIVLGAACASAHPHQCTQSFPFGEGNPWRVLETHPEEITAALWLIDSDPDLELFSMGSEDPGCWAIAFRDVTPSAKATRMLLEDLEALRGGKATLDQLIAKRRVSRDG